MLGKALKMGIGGVGGALMGGAGLIGAGLISATGAGKYVAGATAIGAGAKAGANWLGNKSFGGEGGSDEDPKEELNKVSEIGLLSVEKLDAIYDNVLDLRKFFGDQDPVAQEREKALDEKVKNKELVNAIRGMGGGKGGGGGKGLGGFDWKSLLLLGGLGSLAFLDGDDLKNFIEKLPGWIENIDEAIDNIMEFVKDLDGFFEGLGIEFAGAAIMGTAAGMRRGNRSKMVQAQRERIKAKKAAAKAKADARKKAQAAAKKKQELRQNRNAAKTKRLQGQLTRARLAAAQAQKAYQALLDEQAETKRQARQSRLQKSKTRAGRIKTGAKVAASKFVSKMSRIGGRPGGAPVKPSATSAGTKVSTPKRGGVVKKALKSLTPKITSVARRGGRIARGFSSLAPKITSVARRGGRIARGFSSLAPKFFGGRSSGMGGRPASSFPKIPVVTPNIMGRSSGMGGRPLSDFPEVKAITQGAGRGRPGGAPTKPAATTASKFSLKSIGDMAKRMFGREGTAVKGGSVIPGSATTNTRSRPGPPKKPKIPPKLALAMRALPQWAVKLIMKAMGETGKATAKTLLRIAGPIILGYEVYKLSTEWKDTKQKRFNITPLGNDEEADKVWQDGMMHLAATYGGGYFGAVAGSMVGSMLGGPVGTIVGGLTGGIGGAMLGSSLYESLTKTDQEKVDEKQAELAELTAIPEGKVRGYGGKLIDYNPNNARQRVKYEGRMEKIIQLEEEIKELQGLGPVDDIDAVVVIQNSDNSSTSVSSQNIGTTIQASESYNPVPIFGATFGYR